MADKQPKANGTRAPLDLSAVWSRGIALLRDNAQLIAVLAGLFVLVPNAALQFTLPPDGEMEGPLSVMFDATASRAMQEKAAQTMGELMQPFILSAGIALVISHVGYAGIVALISKGRPTVGEALLQAARVILPLMIALIVTLVSIYIILLTVQLVLSPLGPEPGAFLGAIIGVLTMFYATARLALTLPVMVIEGELNPFKALRRSWQLTGISPSNVFGFWMIMAVAWFVTLMVQGLIALVVDGALGSGSTAALIQGLIGGLFAMAWGALYSAMGVAMHGLLKRRDPAEIASDFD
ncbi:MAG: glycerophosphoryl diester phosphodiesterase membrane domain-containing protein [Pseudomonadota bacterium]